MSRVTEALKHEAAEMGLVAGYFVACFVLIGVVKQLFLLEYDIHGPGVFKAVVGALVVAKVVVVLDKTALGRAFRHSSLAVAAALRSLIYTLAVALVMVLEKVFHGYRETHGLRSGFEHALQAAQLSRAAAIALCVFGCFCGYFLLREAERRLGRQGLRELLFRKSKISPDA